MTVGVQSCTSSYTGFYYLGVHLHCGPSIQYCAYGEISAIIIFLVQLTHHDVII